MPLAGAWFKVWIYLVFVFGRTLGARPRFDTSTDMGLVLVPADAEIDSVIFRLRATDQDADFPLVFEITATITPVVRIDNLPCTLYNKVCQANVILTRRLTPGRLHDFAVRVRDSKGDSNSMQATISVTNATTSRDKIFPHIPSLIMVPEDTRPGKELDYLLVRANQWSGKPVYIELWQPKELFTIRQRQTPSQTRGVITLIGELDFETQSMYTLTMYATDPYTEPGKDTRNIAGLNVVVVVQDVQDVPPIFTLAPPLTRINNSVQPGDVILRVHAEDGDKGVPREITYGLVSEGNPFTPFFNISETTGEIILARPLEDLTQITHVGAPVVLTVVAEELRRSTEEPPAQATVVDVGLLLGEPGNSPPYFESDNYIASIDENLEPGTVITFPEQYSTRVRDEDIGKAGVFALKLFNNNGTFEINPTVAERNADFIITVRDNALIDYEMYKSLLFKIIAQEVGPATNLSVSVPVTIFLKDVNDNPPVFDEDSYEVTLSENVTAGTRVIQVHATDKDTGNFGAIQYTRIIGQGSEAFAMDPDTGLITVAMGSSLDRESAQRLQLSVEARDENGTGNRGVVPLNVNLLDVNDNAPIFERSSYEFMLNADLTNFTSPAIIKAIDVDAEPPNNEVRYELIHGNYENKFHLDEITGELFLRSPITKVRRKKQSAHGNLATKVQKDFHHGHENPREVLKTTVEANITKFDQNRSENGIVEVPKELNIDRIKRADDDALFTLTARAYDLGVPHMSSVTQVRVLKAAGTAAHIVMFVVPGEHPDPAKTAETLATITGGRVTVQDIRPYVAQNQTDGTGSMGSGKKSIVVARVEQSGPGSSLVDIEKIREALAANGVGIIGGTDSPMEITTNVGGTKSSIEGNAGSSNVHTTNINETITTIHNEEVTWYKAENELLFWLLIILGLLILLAIAAIIICCICPGCPFYMAPRKRRVHSSETLIVRSEGRPKRHLHRKQAAIVDASWAERKQAWSADPTRRNWQFNRRNTKNRGQASLPGDVVYISSQQNDVQANVESLRLRDGPLYDHARRSRIDEQERMLYLEDVEAQKVRDYDATEADSLRRHELDRGSDIPRHGVDVYRYVEPDAIEETTVREQHFYRDGNAEVLRLVTRGQTEDATDEQQRVQHRATTLIVDGKDILLRRFIEDQKLKHDLSMHGPQEVEVVRSMESHHRAKELQQQAQQEIILIPERLDVERRQHVEEIGPNVQRLVIDHDGYEESLKIDAKEAQQRQSQVRIDDGADGIGGDRTIPAKEHAQSVNVQTFSFHDVELARQNALLTRLLLEREARVAGGTVMDSTSYLETQSLPGQVAIATQTDRTAATQTERHVRSRSDNDESEDDAKHRKKMKSKKRYEGDSRRIRTLWMKSPIEEEAGPCFDKRLSILRKKVKEVKEGRKVSLEPEVLREISDSLDGNGSSCRGDDEETRTYKRSTEETSIKYKVLDQEDDDTPTSIEIRDDKTERGTEKVRQRAADEPRTDITESTSSQEEPAKSRTEVKIDEKSPKKESKQKTSQKKIESVVKPSFRILEREISVLSKKLSKLGEKKVQESTGSDGATRGKPLSTKQETSKEDQKPKKTEEPSSQSSKPSVDEIPSTSKTSEEPIGQRKETVIAKTRQKLKYQQAHVMSTGSSEYDDSFEKPRKQIPSSIHDNFRQRHAIGVRSQHGKVKRHGQIERKEQKKTVSQNEQDSDRGKEALTKEASKAVPSIDKSGRQVTRAQKLAGSRREYVSEEFSTSTGSDRIDNRRDTRRDSDKKSSTTSESITSRVSQRKVRKTREQPIEKSADDSRKDIQKESSERRTVVEMDAQPKSKGNGKREETMHPVMEPVMQKIVMETKVIVPVQEDEEEGSFEDALKEFARREDEIHKRIQQRADDIQMKREDSEKFEGLKEVVEEEIHRVHIERQSKLEETDAEEESHEPVEDKKKTDKSPDTLQITSDTVTESKEHLSDSKDVPDEEEIEVDVKGDTRETAGKDSTDLETEAERKTEVADSVKEERSKKVEGIASMKREVEQKVESVTKIGKDVTEKPDDSVHEIQHVSSFIQESNKKLEQHTDIKLKEPEAIKRSAEKYVEDIDSTSINIQEKPEKPKTFEDYESPIQQPYSCEVVNIIAAAKGIHEPESESIHLPQEIQSHDEQLKSPTEKSPIVALSSEVPLPASQLKLEGPPVSESLGDKRPLERTTSPLPFKILSPPITGDAKGKQSSQPIISPLPIKSPTSPPVKSPDEKFMQIVSPTAERPDEKPAKIVSPIIKSPGEESTQIVSPTIKSPDKKSAKITSPPIKSPDEKSTQITSPPIKIPDGESTQITSPTIKSPSEKSTQMISPTIKSSDEKSAQMISPTIKSSDEKSTLIVLSTTKSPDKKILPEPTGSPPVTSVVQVSKIPDEKQLPPSVVPATIGNFEKKHFPESIERISPITSEIPPSRKSSAGKLKLSPGISTTTTDIPSGNENVDKSNIPQHAPTVSVELQRYPIIKSLEEKESPEPRPSTSSQTSGDKIPDKDASNDSDTVSPPAKSQISVSGQDSSEIKADDAVKISPVTSQTQSPKKNSDEVYGKDSSAIKTEDAVKISPVASQLHSPKKSSDVVSSKDSSEIKTDDAAKVSPIASQIHSAKKGSEEVKDKDSSKIQSDDGSKISPVLSQKDSPVKGSDENKTEDDKLHVSSQATSDDKHPKQITTSSISTDEDVMKDIPSEKDSVQTVDGTHVTEMKETKELSDKPNEQDSPVKEDKTNGHADIKRDAHISPNVESEGQDKPSEFSKEKSLLSDTESSGHQERSTKVESHQMPRQPPSPPSYKEESLSADKQIGVEEVDRSVGEEQTFVEKADKSDEPSTRQLKGDERGDKNPHDEEKQDEPEDITDETTSAEKSSERNEGKKPKEAEKYTDVSLPIFTSVTDPLDDSDESDSSSDISRKTALNAGPYQTPRHRARKFSDRENIETEEDEDVESLPITGNVDDTKLFIEMEGDKVMESLAVDSVLNERTETETADLGPSAQTISTSETDEKVATEKNMSVDGLVETVAPTSTAVLLDDKAERDATPAITDDKKTDQGKSDLKANQFPSATAKESERGKRTLAIAGEMEGGSKDDKESVPSASTASKQTSKSAIPKPTRGKVKKYESLKKASSREQASSVEEVSDEMKRDASPGKSVARRATSKMKGQKPSDSEPEKRRDSDQTKQPRTKDEEKRPKQSRSKSQAEKEKKSSSSGADKSSSPPKTAGETDASKTQSKYMAWYKQTRDESERRRAEARDEDDEQLPRWLRRSMRQRRTNREERRKLERTPEMTPRTRRKVKPLVNVESEQLKAIVRQGRKLRKAEGGRNEDPPVQIFASVPPKPRPPDAKHHLVQHSEYKYEKMPAPFYLHPPPPAPHPSPQLSPEHFEPETSAECREPETDPGISVGLQGGTRLRHQQLLEKKSVFDIAYSEAAPSQLRSDSTTPPS